MDWNWFFSAIAQSFAAIVGIGSAFIITKIVNNNQIHKININKINEILNQSKFLEETFTKIHDLYREFLFSIEFNSEIFPKMQNDFIDFENDRDNSFENKEYYNLFSKSFRINSNDNKYIDLIESQKIFMINTSKNELCEKLKVFEYKTILNKYNVRVNDHLKTVVEETIDDLENRLKKTKGQIADNCFSIKNLLNKINGNPEYSRFLNFAIIINIVIFILGVILPLSFLPINNNSEVNSLLCYYNSFKYIILFVVSISFIGFLIYVSYNNFKMKYKDKEMELLLKYSKEENYSQYHNYF